MNCIVLHEITKNYSEKQLLNGADFGLEEGEKVGVIGINGTGKSTFLRLCAGVEEPDEGSAVFSNSLKIAYLPQNPVLDPDISVLECVLKGNVEHNISTTVESDARAMLLQFGFTDFNQPVRELSGGQKKRASLINVLLSPADVLILDEPTNHLDSEMADWLENFLKKFRGSLIMVTHDRYFLDSVANRIIELDGGKIYSYKANYEGYLELKAQREADALAAQRKRKSILRTELEWMQRGARARSTKQKAHIQRYETLAAVEDIKEQDKLKLNSLQSRLGKTVVELDHIGKAYGDRRLIDDFSYIFVSGDRIGIIGKNGCGKSTLMKMIDGRVLPDSGHIEIGQTVKLGYFTQENEDMDESLRVIDYVREGAEIIKTEDGFVTASQMLERFLFPGPVQYQLVSSLSGGEKRRLYLLRILMTAPNVLILDEPTNDLDIQTMMILEDYLDTFAGVVITVSHDRYFLDRVVRRIFAFDGEGGIRQFEGGYTDYRHVVDAQAPVEDTEEGWISGRAAQADESEDEKPGKKTWQKAPQKLKMTWKEAREYETIEDTIAKLEADIEQCDKDMLEASRDYVKLSKLTQNKEDLEKQLEEKMERYIYLEDLAEKIAAQ